MKKLAILFLTTCLFANSFGQRVLPNQRQITRYCKKLAKKEFINLWKEGEEVSWLKAYLEASQLTFVPLPSFFISKEAAGYDSSQHIVDYLVPNEEHPIEAALLFRNGRFDGTVDCFDAVFHRDTTPCHIDPSQEDHIRFANYTLKRGYELLARRRVSFLFSVRHIRNCFWFVERNKVFLLDLNDGKVYDPDEYIKLKCSADLIRDMATGKLGQICN
ncbi:hypothetical protein [Nibrella saemangeumensis]|uniref:hypothetical protein n=1 Tax=Nibrella saemangeumensis TaxID=1084526 RepID=UPI0031E750B7